MSGFPGWVVNIENVVSLKHNAPAKVLRVTVSLLLPYASAIERLSVWHIPVYRGVGLRFVFMVRASFRLSGLMLLVVDRFDEACGYVLRLGVANVKEAVKFMFDFSYHAWAWVLI